MTGRIVKTLSGFYYVAADDTLFCCKARGSFRKSGVSPLVGDIVEFEVTEKETGIIDEVLPRKSCLVRPPVANIDKLFIMSAYASPTPNTYLIDKMTVIALFNNIEPIIVFNKSDMGDFTEFYSIYKNAGFKTYVVSAKENIGIDAVLSEMTGCVSAFTGNSGVGKSSLINAIFGNDNIKTGNISEKLGRGKHTTRHTELYALLGGGYIADTPGFSSLELELNNYKLKEELEHLFPDFSEYLGDCKFASCSHTKEKGCALLEAVKDGRVEPSRHESYLRLFDEMKELKAWENKSR